MGMGQPHLLPIRSLIRHSEMNGISVPGDRSSGAMTGGLPQEPVEAQSSPASKDKGAHSLLLDRFLLENAL
jgi:hypothetical protein